ncbi:helix-turn-helix domain-containing protein [Haloactinomyces albus]|uniref:Transcriptional regulator with XRE-family HTH domain n=1 Tax=Haloactinomyces albus TaxID=1352928 RepID=A0AAE3ZC81_9ACTN|nr:helix-turn-helix transcriptional regulator [Haloactinomyces albus]MDR7302237.1 transcriptional regulator with XRE-family HTH domain [Haloactinomyces albus]
MTSFDKRRQDFGERLRRLRDEAGLTGRDLAASLGWPHSKISKLENGKQTAEDADVIAWVGAIGQPESVERELLEELAEVRVSKAAWRAQLRAGHRARQQHSLDIEAAATRIRNAEFGVVPGYLQTADYARHVFKTQAELLEVPAGDIEESVRVRMQRQQVLYQGKSIEIIVSEHALRHPVAPPEAMVAQLDRLVSAVGLPGLRFGVLPQFRRLPNITMNGFIMLDDMVMVEQVSNELTIDDPEQVAIYHRLTDRLWKTAAEDDEARSLLQRISAEYVSQQH